MTEVVRDNAAHRRFELEVGGNVAFVTYRAIPGGLILLHTETPAALRNQGVGSRLARGMLEIVRARAQKIRVACDFLQDFMRRNPEFDDLLM
ncbi:MAG TPA: GNAT family N-acetyltransferase [Stellaceae bacterium]|jgi:hypothetical protein|nr:GNAT family N-acetyltransferase [Stellaceae bacterium]